MDRQQITNISRQYNKCSLWVVAAAALIMLLGINICDARQLVNPVLISVIYVLVANAAYGLSWRAVASSSPGVLGKFYLVASVLRMLTAIIVAAVFCVISGSRDAIINFVLVFSAFYVVMLVFDGVFFVRLERKRNQ